MVREIVFLIFKTVAWAKEFHTFMWLRLCKPEELTVNFIYVFNPFSVSPTTQHALTPMLTFTDNDTRDTQRQYWSDF